MTYDQRYTLAGKYFLQALPDPLGRLLHGKILGVVGHELSTQYLCELYADDPAELAVRSQIVLDISQLTAIFYFYDDRAIYEHAWQQQRAQTAAAEQARALAATRTRKPNGGTGGAAHSRGRSETTISLIQGTDMAEILAELLDADQNPGLDER